MLINKYDRIWYAVLKDKSDEDWGYGSYDFDEAKEMLQNNYIHGLIEAVCDGHIDDSGNCYDADPIAVEDYPYGDLFNVTTLYGIECDQDILEAKVREAIEDSCRYPDCEYRVVLDDDGTVSVEEWPAEDNAVTMHHWKGNDIYVYIAENKYFDALSWWVEDNTENTLRNIGVDGSIVDEYMIAAKKHKEEDWLYHTDLDFVVWLKENYSDEYDSLLDYAINEALNNSDVVEDALKEMYDKEERERNFYQNW